MLLRVEHSDITPGYHMNKKHWNTVVLEGDLSHSLICELIDHSYDLVYNTLSKTIKAELEAERA
jgi:predicted DNA-binding protein (MmcQ/YjbR family)